MVVLTAIVAMNVPKFSLFIGLTGSVAGTLLAFILPALLYNKAFESTISKKKRYFNRFVIILGVVAGSISFLQSFYEIVEAFKMPEGGGH